MRTDVVLQRIASYIIDAIILVVVNLLIIGLFAIADVDSWNGQTTTSGSEITWTGNAALWLVLLLALISLGYKAVQEALWGQTVGKRAMNIVVVQPLTGKPIGWGASIIRNVIFFAPFWILQMSERSLLLPLVGFVWLLAGTISMIASQDRQRLGDRAANTVVVKTGFQELQIAGTPALQTAGILIPPDTAIIECPNCSAEFQTKDALHSIWQGEEVLSCPFCRTDIDLERVIPTRRP